MIIFSILISISVALFEFFIVKHTTVVSISYGFIVPPLVLLPHIVYAVSEKIKKNTTKNWLRYIDRLILALIVINLPGSLYFHRIGFQYDRFIHFASAICAFFIFLLVYLLF